MTPESLTNIENAAFENRLRQLYDYHWGLKHV